MAIRTSHPARVMGMVLAGGEGKRLMPLTLDRAKPAVPFGGTYRLIDFCLSNLVNGGVRKIAVLTQYKSHSLDRHIAQLWRLNPLLGNYIATVPAQMRLGPRWFAGSADAIYQNMNLINDEQPEVICVFGADHIYRMDPQQMVDLHLRTGAGLTLAGIKVPVAEASAFGIIDADAGGKVNGFLEKPADPPTLPGDSDHCYASMGIYVFSTEALLDAIDTDAKDESSKHDLGGSIVPLMVQRGQACVYDFADNEVPGSTTRDRGYWRDVGDLDAYYDASMDLVTADPIFNLYNLEWPIYSWMPVLPPAKFVFDEDGRRGSAVNSLVSTGVIIAGGTVRRSVLSPGVFVHDGALVEDSVLMDSVVVEAGAVVRRAILDKNVRVGAGVHLGAEDAKGRGLTVSAKGVVAVAKGQVVGAR